MNIMALNIAHFIKTISSERSENGYKMSTYSINWSAIKHYFFG